MGRTSNDNKRHRIIKGTPRGQPLISVNRKTNILAYCRKQIPDLLDFFVTNGISLAYTDIQSSYDLTSDHSQIIATIRTPVIVSKPAPLLHNSKTNWDTYRRIIQDNVNLSIKLKEREGVEPDVELTIYSVYSSMLPNKLPQTAIPKEKLINTLRN